MVVCILSVAVVSSFAYRTPNYAPVQRVTSPQMMGGGFGASSKTTGTARKAKPGGLTAKESWDLFRELRGSDRVQTTTVFARLPEDGEKWLNVGGVIVEEPGSRIQAVNRNKVRVPISIPEHPGDATCVCTLH